MTGSTLYLVLLGASALVSALCFALAAKRRKLPRGVALLTPVLSLVSAVLFARLFFFAARADFLLPMYGWAHLFVMTFRELAFGGAVIGFLLAGLLAARLTKQSAHILLDTMAPAGLLMLTLARLSEYVTDLGQGAYIENSGLQFFPLAVRNEYGEWYWAVFMLEALFSLAILLYLLKKPGKRAGETWQKALLLVMLTQVLCESLRAESLKWGFVRVHQLAAALGLAAMTIVYYVKARRLGNTNKTLLPPLLALPLGVAGLIGIEFALDKWEEMPYWALYSAMVLILAALVYTVRKLYRLTAPADGALR